MAIPLATAFVRIRPDTSTFEKEAKTGLTKAGRGLANEGKKHGRVYGTTFARSTAGPFRSIAGIATKSAGLAAGAFAAIGVAKFGKDIINAASDMNESVSKTRVVFGASSKAVESFAKTAATNLGQSRQQALEAASTFGNLFTAMKIGQKPAATMSTRIVTLASDLASFNNVKPEDALEALRAGLVGETEPLRKFGVNLNDAALREEALRLGLVKSTKDVLPPAAKAQAAYSLILDQTKTAQGDFARTSDGLANKQRILSAKWKDAQATLGKALLPAMVTIASVVADKLIPAFGKFAQKIGMELEPVVARLGPMFRQFLKVAGPLLTAALATIGGIIREQVIPAMRRLAENVVPVLLILFEDIGGVLKTVVFPALKILASILFDRIVPVFAAVAKWIGKNRQIIPALGIAIATILVPAFIAWAVSAGAAAVATIAAALPVIALGAAITALAFLIIKNWKTIKQWTLTTWKFVLGVFQTVWEWLKRNWPLLLGILTGPIGIATVLIIKNWKKIYEGLKNLVGAIKDFFQKLPGRIVGWIGAVGRLLFNKGRDIITGLWNGIRNVWASVITWLRDLDAKILYWVGALGTTLYDRGKSVITGFFNGIKSAWSSVISWFEGLPTKILHALGMSPPPQWAIEGGKKIMTGLLKGIVPGGKDILSYGKSIVSGLGVLFGEGVTGTRTFARGNVALGQQLAAQLYGWTGAQWRALYDLWNNESGWNATADNPTSTAFGIPQFLSSTARAYGLAPGDTNPNNQIVAGLRYIKDAYGNPLNAWNAWLSRSPHWYDKGGWLMPGATLAVNKTGKPERVLGPRESYGNTYNINIAVPPSANQHEIGRQTVAAIKAYEKGSGTGWRK
jgi:hypothetical protein